MFTLLFQYVKTSADKVENKHPGSSEKKNYNFKIKALREHNTSTEEFFHSLNLASLHICVKTTSSQAS